MSTEAKGTFFRQSGWMMFSAIACGVFMFAVHIFGPIMGDNEYGLYVALLGMLNIITIPGLGLQGVFMQQTAAAISKEDQARLTAAVRTFLLWTFLFWLLMAALAFIFRKQIIASQEMSNPVALWVILLIGLALLWMPIVLGVVQGKQNFLWLGLANIFHGVGRFAAVGIIVGFLGGKATGAAVGALIGVFCSLSIGVWQSRAVWQAKTTLHFNKEEWLSRVIPLTLGLGASQILFSIDANFVRDRFGASGSGFYGGAGTIGRGLINFTAPLAIVMFPKIVHSLSHGRKTNVVWQTFIATFALGAFAAICCTVGALWLQQIINSSSGGMFVPEFIAAKVRSNREGMRILATLIPWFVWGMLPLAVANVLLNNLLAHRSYRVVLYLVAVVIGYALTLWACGTTFVSVVQILGLFNLIYLGVLAFFTWWEQKTQKQATAV